MRNETGGWSWSERERLRFIERMLYWRGYINRRDLRDFFGISPPQATNDLVNYTTRNPGACAYNVRTRRYEAAPDMEPLLIEPEFGRDLAILGAAAWPAGGADFVVEPERPLRAADAELMRALALAAHRRESLEVRYWSVHSGRADWRRISPRTFAHDGLRWHVRAFCHDNGDFRDFVAGRISGRRKPKPCSEPERVDADWMARVTLVIRPNPELSEGQRKAMEMDYGMRRGKLRLPVRKALLVYVARRLGFIGTERGRNPPMLNELKQLEWLAVEN